MISLKLTDDVLAYVRSPFTYASEKHLLDAKLGYKQCIDHPEVSNHRYCEGYFHSLSTNQRIESIHPRYGRELKKPAAPIEVRAFFETLRDVNQGWWDEFIARLDAVESNALFTEVKALLLNNKMFGDIAVQYHYGDEIAGKDLSWHIDAVNSFLHMAISIQGSRTLCVRDEKEPTKQVRFPQTAPDVYISNPSFFVHAVEYPGTPKWENCIIALQARFLLTCEEFLRLDKARRESPTHWKLLRQIVEEQLTRPFILPALDAIKSKEAELKQEEQKQIMIEKKKASLFRAFHNK